MSKPTKPKSDSEMTRATALLAAWERAESHGYACYVVHSRLLAACCVDILEAGGRRFDRFDNLGSGRTRGVLPGDRPRYLTFQVVNTPGDLFMLRGLLSIFVDHYMFEHLPERYHAELLTRSGRRRRR